MRAAGQDTSRAKDAKASAVASPVIDVHSHFIPDAYWSAIGRRVDAEPDFAELARRNNLVPQLDDGPMRTVRMRLSEMDSAGVDISVISLPPPGVAIRAGDARLARDVNDGLVEAAMSDADRLRVMCVLPLPDADSSIAELRRLRDHPLVRGVAVTTNVQGWSLDALDLQPVYEEIAQADLPLFVHPALEPLPAVFDDFALTASVAAVMSSSLGVLRMIYAGTFDRSPGLTVIMPHLGGVIPYLLQRLMDLGGQQGARYPLRHYVERRLIFDTCSYHPPAFRCAADTVGIGRLALGTDYPFRGSLGRAVEDVRSQHLREDDEAAVLGRTVAHWFA